MTLTGPPPASCPDMGTLIELLNGFPIGQGEHAVRAMIQRLDMLEYEARGRGASAATVAAIQGAKVLLDVSDLQCRRVLSLSSSTERRLAVGLPNSMSTVGPL